MKRKIIIAIDGASSSGKSSLARDLAQTLKYQHIDTGSMYRSITLLGIREKIFNSDLWNQRKFVNFLKKMRLEFQFQWNKTLNETDIILNGENLRTKIQTDQINENVAFISQIPEIRRLLKKIQRKMGLGKGIVIDGRDIGNCVFPESDLKIFLKGSIEIRSYRKYKFLKKKNRNITFERVKKNIHNRDNIDINRKIDPLKKSYDHIEIDNTFLNIQEQIKMINQLINEIIK
ncbi:(d)CMP kinase [Blattabacterium cuenoti]|uniref:(d)CMP kinase n=1 Tax=Blattabacterium cuenoti TaxID=1653831 RepID=UPI00163D12C4|nr:(d)CMP kinase [Blattabacterium cuenoti]